MKKSTQALIVSTIFSTGCRVGLRNADLVQTLETQDKDFSVGIPLSGTVVSVGAASDVFIPQRPVALSGYGGIGRRFFPPLLQTGGDLSFCRAYEKITNPPRIKVATVNVQSTSSQKIQPIFVISLDLVAVTGDMTRRIHKSLAENIKDFEPSLTNTLVLATHTHSGPAGLTQNPLWSTFVCDKFNNELNDDFQKKVLSILNKAQNNSQSVTQIETQTINQPELFRTRFVGMKTASDVTLLSFQTATGDVPLTFVQLAAHPTYYGPRDLTLSADLVTPIENSIQSVTHAKEVFLLQTSIGNMNANLENKEPNAWTAELSQSFKNASIKTSTTLEISTEAGLLPLPTAKINWSGCGAAFAQSLVSLPILGQLPQKAPFTLWSLNKTPHLFLSGEWTTSAADELRSKLTPVLSSQEKIQIFSLANEYSAYHITADDYQKKELESCSSIYGATALETLIRALVRVPFTATF